jgi:outer membrane lipoprotein-sorting protein
MKNIFPLLLASVFAGFPTVSTSAATAEGLIKAHIEALGGVQALKKHTSRVMKGTLKMPEQGITAAIAVFAKAPNKLRTEIEVPGLGKIVEGFDGKVAWSNNPFTGVGEKPADQQAQARRQADFYRDVELLSRFETWTLKGEEVVDGKPADVVEGRASDGRTETLYLDRATRMLVQAKTREGEVNATVRFGDYRVVDGVKVPFSIEADAGSAGRFVMQVSEVTHGVELDEKLFRLPGQ